VYGLQITETKWNSSKVEIKVTWHLLGVTSVASYDARFILNNMTHTFHFFGKRDNVPMGYGQDFHNVRWINFY